MRGNSQSSADRELQKTWVKPKSRGIPFPGSFSFTKPSSLQVLSVSCYHIYERKKIYRIGMNIIMNVPREEVGVTGNGHKVLRHESVITKFNERGRERRRMNLKL